MICMFIEGNLKGGTEENSRKIEREKILQYNFK